MPNDRFGLRFQHPKSGCLKAARAAQAARALNTRRARVTRTRPPSPYPPPSSAECEGVFGEHCSSSTAGHVLCALPGRVAQPPEQASNGGNPRRGWRVGACFLWFFSLHEQRKELAAGCVVVGALAPYNHGVPLAGATPALILG